MAQRPHYVFQEYIGDPRSLEPYFATLQGPPPLFAQFTNAGYHVCHTVISPSSDIAPIAVTENHTNYGHTTLNRRILDSTLDALTVDYARALFLEGVAGPMSIQLRQDRNGAWKALEINLRATGGTLARFLRGMDELYLIIKAFVPGASFPELRPHGIDGCEQVARQYYSYPVFDSRGLDFEAFRRLVSVLSTTVKLFDVSARRGAMAVPCSLHIRAWSLVS
jgi:hypothetical protein